MKDYLSISNFHRAVRLSAVIVLLSVPRIAARMPDRLLLFTAAAFVSLILACGAATAWERRGGLAGLYPSPGVVVRGIIAALILGIASIAAHRLWFDDKLFCIIKDHLPLQVLERYFPRTVAGQAALVLWTASFEATFFYAATVTFWTRILNNATAGIVATVIGRMFIGYLLVAGMGLREYAGVFIVVLFFSGIVSSILFARAGLIAVMIYNGVSACHLFLGPHAP